MQMVMEGPVTNLGGVYQPVILTKIPDYLDGDVVTETVTVTSGMRIFGPDGTAITYSGTLTTMQRMVVTYTMRSDVRWSDGVLVTEQDAVFGQRLLAIRPRRCRLSRPAR